MGLLDDIFGKLVDIKLKLKSGQMGVVNVKTQNKTFVYNIQITNPESAKAFAKEIISHEVQKQIKEDARRRLEPITPVLKMVSDSTAIEVVAAATGLSTVETLNANTTASLTTVEDLSYVKISE